MFASLNGHSDMKIAMVRLVTCTILDIFGGRLLYSRKKVEEEGEARGVQQRSKEPTRTGAPDICVTPEKLSDDKRPQ